jgi:hypothetical protein
MAVTIGLLFYVAWITFMFWVGKRVGKPKNRNWVVWTLCLGWIGVFLMWKVLEDKSGPKPEWLYDPVTGKVLS